MFLEISQNSQENTGARVSFLIKLFKKTLAQVFFCEFCEISRNTFSSKTPPVAASVVFKCLFVISHTLHFTLFYLRLYFIQKFFFCF